MTQEIKINGWVAADKDSVGNRRVTVFPNRPPVRDMLTEHHYWAMNRPYYERIVLSDDLFPDLKWEDKPIEVEILIKRV